MWQKSTASQEDLGHWPVTQEQQSIYYSLLVSPPVGTDPGIQMESLTESPEEQPLETRTWVIGS